MKEKILVVDDEKEIANLLEVFLKNEGYEVFKFYTAHEALRCVNETDINLAILDVMLPDMDGFQLCQKVRENYFFPIIMLTARVEDMDKITGLTLGADDYMTKPFNPLEVVARTKTQLRRYRTYNREMPNEINAYECDVHGLIINKQQHTCHLYGKEVVLTPLEFSLIWYLCEKRGNVVSSEELFEHVWGEKYINSNNTIMAHVGRIREKLQDSAKNPKFIKTVWGVGYKIE